MRRESFARALAGILAFGAGLSFEVALASAKQPVAASPPLYAIEVRLMPEEHRLEATGTIRLPAAGSPRETIGLVLSNQMEDLRVEVLEPRESAGEAALSSTPKDRSRRWTVRPPRPFPAGKPVTLRFSYGGGKALDVIFYVGPEVSFATPYGTDWYPLLDAADDKGVGTLRLSVPAGQLALAEGESLSTSEERARGTFVFENRYPSYFSFAAGAFHVVRREGAVPVVLYLLHERPSTGPFADGIARMVEVLADEFGPYPFKELALVEIPRPLADRAGFHAATMQGFIYVNHRAFDAPDPSVLYEFLGHEIAHSWFPQQVALRTPPGLYMEEALGEYGGMRVVETLAGAAAAEQLRRSGYAPDPMFSALEYFKLVAQGVDHPLASLEHSREHRLLAYTKGAFVFDMLSREVGRERMRRALHRITRAYAFKGLAWSDFLREVEAGTGRRLDRFYDQWFGRTGAPDFQLAWSRRGGTVSGAITQSPPFYRATVEVVIDGEDGRRLTRSIRVDGPSTAFTLRVRFPVRSVALDPFYKILRWTPELRAAAEAAATASRRSRP